MEAIEFLKEYRRMCKSHTGCIGCPLENTGCNIPDSTEERLQEIIRVTEQWNKEHPIITNAQKFKEVFGKIELKDYIKCRVNHMSEDETEIEILEGKWWNEPYKEPEHDL